MGEKKIEYVTMEQAIDLINEAWGLKGENYVSRQTIYQYVWRGKVKNHGRRNKGMFDPAELLREFGPKSA